MAAHEEQISQNRRRLFTALSAAPVVATLTPGSALANQSAFQCLVNQTTPANFHLADPGCGTGEICYAYQQRVYWNVADGTANPAAGAPGTWPATIQALLGQTIVETQPGVYFTLNGDLVDPLLLEVAGSGEISLVTGSGPSQTVYVSAIPQQTGLALQLIEPLDVNGASTAAGSTNAPPTQIDLTGVFPEVQPTGNLQGITVTCLTSIMPSASGFSVARG